VPPTVAPPRGNHFCCALTAVLIARVRRVGGQAAVAELLRRAASPRALEDLEDIGQWITFDEMIALWEAGALVTGDPDFARHVGEDAVSQLGGSSTSTVLRTLGSPEALLRKVAVAGRRFSVVADLEALESRAGYAEIRATAAAGFARHPLHCAWTQGMFTQATVLFGLPPSVVEHDACQAEGAPECRYTIRWPAGGEHDVDPREEILSLRRQLSAMSERLESVFATAADLIGSDNLDDTLARITNRAALQVRAPQYVLAVRPTPDSEVLWHQQGFEDDEARDVARRIVQDDPGTHPEHWLVAPVRSHRTAYGALAAMYRPGETFFPAERQLLDLYARYAATALDSAAALREARDGHRDAQARYQETRALLDLARRLATAGSSDQVAQRLVEAVPAVVDCDRVGVYLWDDAARALLRHVVHAPGQDADAGLSAVHPENVPVLARLAEQPDPAPIFIDLDRSPVNAALRDVGAVASVAVPIVTDDRLLGCLVVSVLTGPARLEDTPELRDRLSGVAAHAVQALLNGRLVDHITHQATHDQLTRVANRTGFYQGLARVAGAAAGTSAALALFYVDLDDFKLVNDELGHEVGDGLLQAVADRLVAQVRARDLVARIGGDEFVVLVAASGEAELGRVTDRLERAFATPFLVDGHRLPLGASVGRAVWPADVDGHDALLARADGAMYQIKNARRAAAPAATPAA
jgi:diguanylate cyclase (GGDEF)-like protein